MFGRLQIPHQRITAGEVAAASPQAAPLRCNPEIDVARIDASMHREPTTAAESAEGVRLIHHEQKVVHCLEPQQRRQIEHVASGAADGLDHNNPPAASPLLAAEEPSELAAIADAEVPAGGAGGFRGPHNPSPGIAVDEQQIPRADEPAEDC